MIGLALHFLHDNAGHLGVEKTVDKLRQRFYWFGLREDTEIHIQSCITCQQCKNPPKKAKAPLHNVKTGYPFEKLGIDIVGPIPPSEKGNKYIVVLVDYFTKYPFAFPLKDIQSETVAESIIDSSFCTFGVPISIHSDQGSNFESWTFQSLCKMINTVKTRTTPFAP